MKDTIVQEVRDARAAISADFGGDLGKFFTWAKAHATAERKAKHPLPIHPRPLPLKSRAPKKGLKQQPRQSSVTP
jgi:hypothetical protein